MNNWKNWTAYYDNTPYLRPPPPKLNGGLYTGDAFVENAPWANIPVIPDAGYFTNVLLQSADPPPNATRQYPGVFRPGNSYSPLPGVRSTEYGVHCVGCTTPYTG